MSSPDIVAFLYKWQTIIAALIALAAAWIATRPVYGQLARMETQTNVMLREILVRQVPLEEQHRDSATKSVAGVTEEMMRHLVDGDDFDTTKANPEWASYYEQRLSVEASRFETFRNSYRDAEIIENAKEVVAAAIKVLIDTLDDIHSPYSRDQHGEDYSISDEKWAAIKERARVAPEELPSKLVSFDQAAITLNQAYAIEIDALRSRLRKLDDALFA